MESVESDYKNEKGCQFVRVIHGWMDYLTGLPGTDLGARGVRKAPYISNERPHILIG